MGDWRSGIGNWVGDSIKFCQPWWTNSNGLTISPVLVKLSHHAIASA
ncbi:MAG: hypothetical protein HC847_06030 [Hydrococcus sp. RU_2_2]|nr:hypothetical protein [Hydrococcus sp. RU_2_2]NJP17849.1 hypothetical protein [Hydrococcus sp. CRU_1_1]